MTNNPLQSSVQFLKGVGPARLEVLRRLGIATVGDLLFHLPRTFEDLSDFRSIAALTPGTTQTVRGEVVEIDGRSLADGRTIVSVVVCDNGRDCLEGIWFNQPGSARRFRYGMRVAFSGKPQWFRDHWQMNGPRVQILEQGDGGNERRGDGQKDSTDLVVPVYPMTENLRPDQLRAMLRQAVDK